jgi:hypothetical protein
VVALPQHRGGINIFAKDEVSARELVALNCLATPRMLSEALLDKVKQREPSSREAPRAARNLRSDAEPASGALPATSRDSMIRAVESSRGMKAIAEHVQSRLQDTTAESVGRGAVAAAWC